MPTTWDGWAARVSAYVREGKKLLGLPRFPIRIAEIAHDYSRNVFPSEPITHVEGQDFAGKFEGALVPNEDRRQWAIFYDKGHASKGRINYTLAHELGHYLAHRHLSCTFYCSRRDMWGWDSDYARMEAEANSFAAFVLMPPDDFRQQTQDFRSPTLSDFAPLRDRYEVSTTAAVLNWLKATERRAMLVISRDGFIDWAWGSEPLFRSGVYFSPKKITTPVPDASLAAQGVGCGVSKLQHPPGVWHRREAVLESVIFSEYHEMTLSLLIYPAQATGGRRDLRDEDELLDTFDAFQR